MQDGKEYKFFEFQTLTTFKYDTDEMSHKNFRANYTNCDENFYGEFHVALLKNKKHSHETY